MFPPRLAPCIFPVPPLTISSANEDVPNSFRGYSGEELPLELPGERTRHLVQAHHALWHLSAAACFCFVLFLRMEGKVLHQQKDYDQLYRDTCLIVVAWRWTGRTSEACLYQWSLKPKWQLRGWVLLGPSFLHLTACVFRRMTGAVQQAPDLTQPGPVEHGCGSLFWSLIYFSEQRKAGGFISLFCFPFLGCVGPIPFSLLQCWCGRPIPCQH